MLQTATQCIWNTLSTHIDMYQCWIHWRNALLREGKEAVPREAHILEQVHYTTTDNGQQDYPLYIDYNVAAEP